MSWTQAKKDAFGHTSAPFEIRFLVEKDNGTWLDLTDRISKDRLLNLGQISHTAEKRAGEFCTETRSVELDNQDGYFSSTPPSGVSTWLRHRCKITINGESMGMFLISDGPKLNTIGSKATFDLTGLHKKLMDKNADGIKNGQSWYEYRPVGFLVKKLYESEFPAGAWESGSPPTDLSVPVASGSIKPSIFGRPPEWDGSNWLELGLICRALVYYSGKLYLGCDNQCWVKDLTTGVYTHYGDTTAGSLIRDMWWDNAQSKFYFVSWPDHTTLTTTMKVWSRTLTGSPVLLKTITDVYTGDKCYRRGRGTALAGVPTIGNPLGESDGSGESLCIPFNQYIQSSLGTDAQAYNDDGASPLATVNEANPHEHLPLDIIASYKLLRKPTGIDVYLPVFFTVGQRYAVAYRAGFLGYALGHDGDPYGSPPTYDVYTLDVITDTTKAEGLGYSGAPIAMQLNSGASRLYVASIAWIETYHGISVSSLDYYEVGGGGWTEVWCSSNLAADYYKTIVSIYYSMTTGLVHGCYMNRDRIYGSKYQTFVMIADGSTKVWNLPLASAMPFAGFVVDGDYVYFLDMGNGQLYRQTDSTTSPVIELQGGGIPAVDAESCLLAGLTVKTGTPPTFYGISSPTPLIEANSAIPTGKYYLFQFGNVLTDRVELADFGDLSKWDALKLLARRCLCTVGFNLDGEFYFKPIPTGTPTETFVGPDMEPVASTEYACASIQREPGLDEIFNVVELFPYASVLKNPDCVLERGPSSSIASETFFQQRDIGKKNVYLYCVAGGRVLADNVLNKLRFRWILEDSLFETSLRVASNASDTYIDVYSVTDVAAGDYIQVQDSADKIVSSVDTANNRINLTTTVGAIYPIGASVFIRKSGYRYTSDHKDGITLLNGAAGTGTTLTVDSTANLSIGTVIRLESSAGVEECRIVTVDSLTQITVTRGIAGSSAVDHADNTPVRAFWSPNDQTKFFEIGQTRVDLKIVDQADASTHEETETRRTFQVGDRFRITCAGASLEKIEMAKQSAIDTASVNKYGRLVYPDSDNRFLNYSYASELVQKLLTEYKNPKFKVLPAGPLLPWALPNSLIYVKSRAIFPGETNYQVACRITQANFDPRKKNGSWQLRGLTSYNY